MRFGLFAPPCSPKSNLNLLRLSQWRTRFGDLAYQMKQELERQKIKFMTSFLFFLLFILRVKSDLFE